MFWFHLIFLESRSPNEFRAEVLDKLGPYSEHWITHLIRRSALDPLVPVETQADFQTLENHSELEVILFWY